jgi:hypothetical protein
VSIPQLLEREPELRMHELRREVAHRAQHERVLDQVAARDLQVAGTAPHEIAVQHDVDVERAAGKARTVATTAVACFERMQPRVELERFQVGIERDCAVQELRAVEADRSRAIHGRDVDRAEALAQLRDRRFEVRTRLEVAAERQVRARHRPMPACVRAR